MPLPSTRAETVAARKENHQDYNDDANTAEDQSISAVGRKLPACEDLGRAVSSCWESCDDCCICVDDDGECGVAHCGMHRVMAEMYLFFLTRSREEV